jgi:hypothetical protein
MRSIRASRQWKIRADAANGAPIKPPPRPAVFQFWLSSDMVGQREAQMFTISWGADSGVQTHHRDTAVEALALAEEFIAANRPNLTILDRPTGLAISIDDLRRRAAAERGDKTL